MERWIAVKVIVAWGAFALFHSVTVSEPHRAVKDFNENADKTIGNEGSFLRWEPAKGRGRGAPIILNVFAGGNRAVQIG